MPQNMRRLNRGELTRIKPQKGPHTDVHIGAPGESVRQMEDPASAKLQKQVQDLTARNEELEAKLKEAERTLDTQVKEAQDKLSGELGSINAKVAELIANRAELEKQLADRDEPEVATGVRVLEITEVSEADNLMRIDCKFKPTSGPMGDTGAIILPVPEFDKLLEEM